MCFIALLGKCILHFPIRYKEDKPTCSRDLIQIQHYLDIQWPPVTLIWADEASPHLFCSSEEVFSLLKVPLQTLLLLTFLKSLCKTSCQPSDKRPLAALAEKHTDVFRCRTKSINHCGRALFRQNQSAAILQPAAVKMGYEASSELFSTRRGIVCSFNAGMIQCKEAACVPGSPPANKTLNTSSTNLSSSSLPACFQRARINFCERRRHNSHLLSRFDVRDRAHLCLFCSVEKVSR